MTMPQKGFLGLLGLLLLTILIQGWRLHRVQEARLVAEANVAAYRDSTIALTRTAKERAAFYVSERAILAGVNADLRRQLNAAQVQSVVRVTMQARPESTQIARPAIARVDTVQRYDVVVAEQEVAFNEFVGRYHVEGWTRTPPPEVWLKVSQEPVALTIIAEQIKDRWRFVADTGDTSVVIGAIDGKVVLRRPGWWTRYKFWVGVVLGGVGMAMLR